MFLAESSVALFGDIIGKNLITGLEIAAMERPAESVTRASAAMFVNELIRSNRERGLEHGSIVALVNEQVFSAILRRSPFIRACYDSQSQRAIVSGSVRAWRDMFKTQMHSSVMREIVVLFHAKYPEVFFDFANFLTIKEYVHEILVPTDIQFLDSWEDLAISERMVHMRKTARVICSRLVANEIKSHRQLSTTQETIDRNPKFDAANSTLALVFILPHSAFSEAARAMMTAAYKSAENLYIQLVNKTLTPESASEVLPHSLKTELIISGNLDQFSHFVNCRVTYPDQNPDVVDIARALDELLKTAAIYDGDFLDAIADKQPEETAEEDAPPVGEVSPETGAENESDDPRFRDSQIAAEMNPKRARTKTA